MLKRSLAVSAVAAGSLLARQYSLGPDSLPKEGVPHGAVTKYTWRSQGGVFPGTERDYWVYVPAQYDPAKPACLMVFQDGGGYVDPNGSWRTPAVFDNLIADGGMPVTIGVFVNPGVVPSASGGQPLRYNRSFEYDTPDDRYGRFLLDELLPEVKKHWNISENPNDRAISGLSSGGIASFTAAMLRPDSFHRVLSFIGSFTGLRGGNVWPDLIRKMDPAPLRIFLQDGNRDLDIFAGNWWIANQDMASALQYRGYDLKLVTGTEDHNAKQGGSIFPDALRWLWDNWPKPISTPHRDTPGSFADISHVIEPGQDWEIVGEGYGFTEGPAVDAKGNVFFVDVKASRIYRIDGGTGKVAVWHENTGGASGLMFGRNGKLYAAENGAKRIVAFDPDGKETVLAENVGSNDLAVSTHGDIYFTDPSTKHVWLINGSGNRRAVNDTLQFPNGIRFSANEQILYVADSATRWVWSFRVQQDGSLTDGEPFDRLTLPLTDSGKLVNSWADGITFDTNGYLYAATNFGIQICDQLGRVFGVLRKPSSADPSNLVFGGPDFHTLYVTAKDKVFRRRLQTSGYLPWQAPAWPRPQL